MLSQGSGSLDLELNGSLLGISNSGSIEKLVTGLEKIDVTGSGGLENAEHVHST